MLMLVRRNRRRSLLAATVAAGTILATVVTAVPAAAVGGGFDPHAAPVTIPGTSTVVNEWKLAGQGFAQGVQVAPQWIIASGHAPAGVGSRFTNEYGSATVDKTTVCGAQLSGCDISVSHLSTPIAAPGFPTLLQDGVPDETGFGRTAAGNTLAVGNGGQTNGRPDAGWTQPTQSGMNLATLQALVTSINGDSGGPAFFYRLGATTGVLQGLMTTSAFGVIGGLTQFTSARIKPFLDAQLPTGTVRWTTYDQLGTRLYVPEPIANPTATATANSITLSWPAVTATPAVVRYRAVLVRADDPTAIQVINTPTSVRTATFTGMPAGVAFGAFVIATNANGDSRVPFTSVAGGNPPTFTYSTLVADGPPASAPTKVAVTSGRSGFNFVVTHGANYINGLTKTEIVVSSCGGYDPCSPANPPRAPISDAIVNGSNSGVTLPANTPPGYVFQIQVRDINTVGASPWLTTMATYAPMAAALPVSSVTVGPQADGRFSVTFTPAAAEPSTQGTVLVGYVPHTQPTGYDVRVLAAGSQTPVDLDVLDPSLRNETFNLADYNLSPGTYTVQVVPQNLFWGAGAPVSVTMALGAVANPPAHRLATIRTPFTPPQPTNLVVPPVEFDGHNESFDNTMTWVESPSATNVATPDEFVITMQDRDNPGAPPTVVEVPPSVHSYSYQVNFAHQYDVNVYAVSQAAGSSVPATAVGEGPGL